MASSSIEERIAKLATDVASLAKDVTSDDASRKQLYGVIMGAKAKVESPMDTIWTMIMSPHGPASLMVLIRAGVVKDLVTAGKPKTAKELADSTGAAEMLIIRMMRPLVALGVFRETDNYTYDSTPISQTLMAPPLISGYQFMFDAATRSLANLPRYLEKTNFAHVDDAPGPFQDCNNSDDGLFENLTKRPEYMTFFNQFMSGSIAMRPEWFKAFDAKSIMLDGAKKDPDSVLLVDVGGGEGHDVEAFGKAFPDAPGKLVLQDLGPVIENIKPGTLDDRIERQKIDMFKEQPVKAAKAYYFRHIFHDWPDHTCVQILKNHAAVMEKGYSKLVIFEWILPSRGVPLYPALLDVNMMALLNAKERTEEQWNAIMKEAGLKVIKFHKVADDAEGLVEAELG
jgi:hypothetical protein